MPVNDFERYDREPPSCSAYETIASEDMDESLHATDNNYSCNFPQEACDMTQPRMNEMRYIDFKVLAREQMFIIEFLAQNKKIKCLFIQLYSLKMICKFHFIQ